MSCSVHLFLFHAIFLSPCRLLFLSGLSSPATLCECLSLFGVVWNMNAIQVESAVYLCSHQNCCTFHTIDVNSDEKFFATLYILNMSHDTIFNKSYRFFIYVWILPLPQFLPSFLCQHHNISWLFFFPFHYSLFFWFIQKHYSSDRAFYHNKIKRRMKKETQKLTAIKLYYNIYAKRMQTACKKCSFFFKLYENAGTDTYILHQWYSNVDIR